MPLAQPNEELVPYLYQCQAVKKIYDDKRVLVADDMGLGKTVEAIAAKTYLDYMNRRKRNPFKNGKVSKALVVCPGGVIPHWIREIRKWSKKKNVKIATITSTNYEADLKAAKDAEYVITAHIFIKLLLCLVINFHFTYPSK